MSRNPPSRRVSANGQITVGRRHAGRIVRIEDVANGVMVRFVDPAPAGPHEPQEEHESIADHLEAAFELVHPEELRREMIAHGCDREEINDLFGPD